MPKKTTQVLTRGVFLFLFSFSLLEKCAFAYLDPGSGSFIFQILIGVWLIIFSGWKTILHAVKTFLSKLLALIKKRK